MHMDPHWDPPPPSQDASSFNMSSFKHQLKEKKQTNKVSSGDHEHTITRHLDCDPLISSTPAFIFSWPSDENDLLSPTLTPFSLTTLHFDSQQTKQTSSSQKTQYLSLKSSLSAFLYFSSVFSLEKR